MDPRINDLVSALAATALTFAPSGGVGRARASTLEDQTAASHPAEYRHVAPEESSMTGQSDEKYMMVLRSEWESMTETLHLLGTIENAEQLLASIREAQSGQTVTTTPEDLRREFGFDEPG